ncbi:hypothetical protein [Bradyrhizobium ottawaense]|uniref:Uncharacterized protein n=1 Tax=Bradyrhizobium ottawaense TaxID=931866 RepID=A0ABY0QH00_9BRAD|nr:hypothetical protein [Bradyrhizobium ottawaense]SDK38535.1 hypothetical protein SAMN05444163_7987 [Bradyrhizobium ottawaense]SDK46546.1 hypothetical protein SAMN05444163_8180 [Bradyrhizobium ottawaense]
MTRPKAPCNDQTAEQLEAYYRKVKPGDVAVIRCTQGNVLRYLLDKVTDTTPKSGRVYVEKGDAWAGQGFYMKSGKSTDAPTGQSNLVVPTDEVMAWIKDHPEKPGLGHAVMSYEWDWDFTPPGQRTGKNRSSFTSGRARQAVIDRMVKKKQ